MHRVGAPVVSLFSIAKTNPSEFRNRPMRIRQRNSSAVAVMLFATCWGCGSDKVPLPHLIPVKGKVTYKGQVLTTGVVRFELDGYGRMASGKLQTDGTYVVSTLKPADGVVAGSHRVFITETDKNLANDRAFEKFTQAATSGLTADVSSEKTEFTFDLK